MYHQNTLCLVQFLAVTLNGEIRIVVKFVHNLNMSLNILIYPAGLINLKLFGDDAQVPKK